VKDVNSTARPKKQAVVQKKCKNRNSPPASNAAETVSARGDITWRHDGIEHSDRKACWGILYIGKGSSRMQRKDKIRHEKHIITFDYLII
jgi:hypothetical protein